MCITSYVDPGDLVRFCGRSLNRREMDVMEAEGPNIGLDDPSLEENLTKENYQDVLVALWSEKDQQRRITWLQSKANSLHPVLMFEQAVAEFIASPTVERIYEVCLPLINAAMFRVNQDCQCVNDLWVKCGHAASELSRIYETRLYRQVEVRLTPSVKEIKEIIKNKKNERNAAIREKIIQTAQSSLTQNLPSPNWVGRHGKVLFSKGFPNMYSVERHKEIRDKYARKTLEIFFENRKEA